MFDCPTSVTGCNGESGVHGREESCSEAVIQPIKTISGQARLRCLSACLIILFL